MSGASGTSGVLGKAALPGSILMIGESTKVIPLVESKLIFGRLVLLRTA